MPNNTPSTDTELDRQWPQEWDIWKRIAFLIDEVVDSYADKEFESYYPSIESELIPKLKAQIKQLVLDAQQEMTKPTRPTSSTQATMLKEINSGVFTTCYNFGKRHGISHQAASQAYNKLKSRYQAPEASGDKEQK